MFPFFVDFHNKKPASEEDGGREIRILNFTVSIASKNKNIGESRIATKDSDPVLVEDSDLVEDVEESKKSRIY